MEPKYKALITEKEIKNVGQSRWISDHKKIVLVLGILWLIELIATLVVSEVLGNSIVAKAVFGVNLASILVASIILQMKMTKAGKSFLFRVKAENQLD